MIWLTVQYINSTSIHKLELTWWTLSLVCWVDLGVERRGQCGQHYRLIVPSSSTATASDGPPGIGKWWQTTALSRHDFDDIISFLDPDDVSSADTCRPPLSTVKRTATSEAGKTGEGWLRRGINWNSSRRLLAFPAREVGEGCKRRACLMYGVRLGPHGVVRFDEPPPTSLA